MRKKMKALIAGIALLMVAALFKAPEVVQSSIPSVYYITPNQATYENIVSCTGTVQSTLVQSVYLETALVAERIHVEIGDRVQAGDILLTIDQDRTSQLAQSPLASLLLFQDLSEHAAETLHTNSIDWASMAAAYGLTATVSGEAVVDQYKREIESLLQQSGVLSNASSAVGVFASPTIEGVVTAPISGVITEVSVRQSVPMTAGTALITVADDSSYKVMAAVNESDIALIKLGDQTTIRGVGFGGSVYTGTVVKIYPTARKTLSGTTTETVVDVEIEIENPNSKLKPGFTAKIEIIGEEDQNLLTVPYEAIRQDESNEEYVYIYEDGKIRRAPIVTGKELTNEVQILSGLDADSIVIYNPSDITREGMMIHLKGRADVN